MERGFHLYFYFKVMSVKFYVSQVMQGFYWLKHSETLTWKETLRVCSCFETKNCFFQPSPAALCAPVLDFSMQVFKFLYFTKHLPLATPLE